jgi:hypothetical protein
MSANDTFLAIFLGSKTSARMTAWNALSEEAREPAGESEAVPASTIAGSTKRIQGLL